MPTKPDYIQNSCLLYSANSQYAYGSSSPYYMYMTYNDPYWDLKVSPATPEDVRVKKAK
jgi:hypothetical protein